MIKSPLESLIELFTSSSCVICGQGEKALCEGCFISSYGELDQRCYKCNKITLQNRVCKSCKSSSAVRRCWWLSAYQKELKELILRVKYQRERHIARLLGEYLALTLPYLPEDTLISSIPTASSRIRRRGYDQAALIAHTFARHRNLSYKQLITRSDQQELIGKRRAERVELMKGLYQLKQPEHLKCASVLLIDDVLTTGASIEAAASLLRKNGVVHVDAAVMCRKLL